MIHLRYLFQQVSSISKYNASYWQSRGKVGAITPVFITIINAAILIASILNYELYAQKNGKKTILACLIKNPVKGSIAATIIILSCPFFWIIWAGRIEFLANAHDLQRRRGKEEIERLFEGVDRLAITLACLKKLYEDDKDHDRTASLKKIKDIQDRFDRGEDPKTLLKQLNET